MDMSVGMTIINNNYYSLNIIKTLSRMCTFLFKRRLRKGGWYTERNRVERKECFLATGYNIDDTCINLRL